MTDQGTTVLDVALEAARRAGVALREGLAGALAIEYKGAQGNDPVTEVDRRSEAIIAETIRATFPGHRLLSEEGTTGGDDPDWRWIVDPLDGTINYAHGLPFSCISIAVEQRGETVVGVVYNPLSEEMFCARLGEGATLNGRPIKVSSTVELRRALLSAEHGTWQANGRRFNRAATLGHVAQGLRDLGSAALELCFVACGRLDGMAGATLNAWDVAAGALIVREAGGQITDANGDPVAVDGRHFVVSNGRLHGAILARLHDDSAPVPPKAEEATKTAEETHSGALAAPTTNLSDQATAPPGAQL